MISVHCPLWAMTQCASPTAAGPTLCKTHSAQDPLQQYPFLQYPVQYLPAYLTIALDGPVEMILPNLIPTNFIVMKFRGRIGKLRSNSVREYRNKAKIEGRFSVFIKPFYFTRLISKYPIFNSNKKTSDFIR